MRMPTLATIAAASAVILLAGCSGNGSSAISSIPAPAGQARTHSMFGHSTSVLPPAVQRIPRVHTSDAKMSFNSCPSSGTLIYMADFSLSVVNIYDSTLTMCGQLTGLTNPQGMTVWHGDLLVANTDASNVLRYHRGATTPFRTYVDPTNAPQFPVGVTVLRDGTVIASNIFSSVTGLGSLSTWTRTGTLVGNFVPPSTLETFFVTSKDSGNGISGAVFADGFDSNGLSAFWTMTCPGGACTGMTEIGEAMSFPGGVTDTRSGDILASDQISNTGDTFEMPSLTPATFSWNAGGDTDGIDGTTNTGADQIYGADALNNLVNCFNYTQAGSSPSTCGSVAGNSGGQAIGIAVDSGS